VTNRLLSRLARRIHLAFPEAKEYVPADRAVVSGNPVRRTLAEADRDAARDHFGIPAEAQVLLVVGGSLGSAAINAAVEQHVRDGLDQNPKLHIIWQTGSRYFYDLQARVDAHPRLHLMQYIDRMDYAYAAADLALCRAGAITCSELMVTGTPAVLVPSPNVTADHQTKNARSMATAGAARLLPEDDLPERLMPVTAELFRDAAQRRRMADAARQMARPDAAERIARDILTIADASVPNDRGAYPNSSEAPRTPRHSKMKS
jgi:UDP-N-acetylglucosamine--N-acetylmuramyl-(pentapeptide) pyrophosphoryl-undecaprenol N-acetylglucosamine transferase